MRSILRTPPIRWQIALLHATILALVLAAGGLAVWNAQRAFQYDSMIARQLTELRALLPAAPDRMLEAGIQLFQNTDSETLKARYAKITAALLPPGKDPAVARRQLALLNPTLIDQAFPPGSALPSPDEMEAIVSKLVFNGIITNDKFCCTRWATLPLSWWRRPLRLRS